MKQVKCKSGITGSQYKLQESYTNYAEFKEYCKTYGIHSRLGYKTMKAAWEANLTIQSSTEPSDLSVVFFHAVKRKDGSLKIKETTEVFCFNVKNSQASFLNKEGAQHYIATH